MMARWRLPLLAAGFAFALSACGSSRPPPAPAQEPAGTLVAFSEGETIAVDVTAGTATHVQGPLKELLYVPSPDGTKLAYACGDDGSAYIDATDTGICVHDDSGDRQLTRSTDLLRPAIVEDQGVQINASWSPDSRSIAFLARERVPAIGYSSGDIYVADVAGDGGVRRIAEGEFARLWGPLAWSPDGAKIAVRNSSRFDAPDDLWIIDIGAGTTSSLTLASPTGLGGIEVYAWSPDSSSIAFTQNTGEPRLYAASADGQDVRDLGLVWGGQLPAWSPDGKWIAATDVKNNFSRVFVVSSDGSDRRYVDAALGRSDGGAWSPDSKRLAFSGSRSGDFNDPRLFIFDVGSLSTTATGEGETLAFTPLIAFSPDGEKLLFTAEAQPCAEGCPPGYLYSMDADGSGPAARVSTNTVFELLSWQP